MNSWPAPLTTVRGTILLDTIALLALPEAARFDRSGCLDRPDEQSPLKVLATHFCLKFEGQRDYVILASSN